MGALRLTLTIIYIIDCIFLLVIVLMQEGKSQGLGAIGGGGSSESFWSKNKGRSKEGKMVTITTVSAVLFIVLSAVLNLNAI